MIKKTIELTQQAKTIITRMTKKEEKIRDIRQALLEKGYKYTGIQIREYVASKLYPTERADDKYKIMVNDFVKELGKIRKRNKHQALILESRTMLTTKKLIEGGFKKSNIHIPNPFEYKFIKRKHKNTYNMTMKELLDSNTLKKDSISLAFFDYCCSLEKNANIKPLDDLVSYFDNEYATTDSVIGVTLSFRGGRATENDQMLQIAAKLDYHITCNAKVNKYDVIKIPRAFCYHGMMVLFYKIRKVK